ncbi:hypothetical protein [Terrimonas alba]|uniref:hypothetical protein n=1 Tax=Terrimonas alba TaxID=3349636 RepID=UPI0035F35264
MELIQNQPIVLAHWTYNEGEWRNFIKWEKNCQSWFHLAGHYLFGKKKIEVPDITITSQKVWIGDEVETFNDVDRQLKKVLVTDAGDMNVLTISYVILNNGQRSHREIKIPVPLRKLREAIHLTEKLKAFS